MMHPIFGVPYYTGDIVFTYKNKLETGQALHACDGTQVPQSNMELYEMLRPDPDPSTITTSTGMTHYSVPDKPHCVGNTDVIYNLYRKSIQISDDGGSTWSFCIKRDTWLTLDICSSKNGEHVYVSTAGGHIMKNEEQSNNIFGYSVLDLPFIVKSIQCDESGENVIGVLDVDEQSSEFPVIVTNDGGTVWRRLPANFDVLGMAGNVSVVLGADRGILYLSNYALGQAVNIHELEEGQRFKQIVVSRNANFAVATFTGGAGTGVLLCNRREMDTWRELETHELPIGVDSNTIEHIYVSDNDELIIRNDDDRLFFTHDKFMSTVDITIDTDTPNVIDFTDNFSKMVGYTSSDPDLVEPMTYGDFFSGVKNPAYPDFSELPHGEYYKIVIQDPV